MAALLRASSKVCKRVGSPKAAIGSGRERLIGARVESHPAISAEQEETSHCLIGHDIYPYRTGRGRRTVVVKLNGHAGLPVYAELYLGT